MKKIIITLGIVCLSASVTAQRAVRIGNMEIIVRVQEQDTTMQVNVLDDPCPPCPPEGSETGSKPKAKFKSYHYSSCFGGVGFIMSDVGHNDNYEVLGGNSINFDIGGMQRYQLTRWFALVGTAHYSYYNYRLYDVAEDPAFNDAILNGSDYSGVNIRKQVFRSHNAAAGAFTRFYLAKPKRYENNGVFIDLGIQGDWAFSRYYKLKIHEKSNEKHRDGYMFKPFAASCVARVGLKYFSIYARYRLTDAFNKPLQKDLPPLTIGVQF